MPTAPNARFDPFTPEVEKKNDGWIVLHFTGSAWIPKHHATEDEAKRHAKELAGRIGESIEFVLVLPALEAYLPKR